MMQKYQYVCVCVCMLLSESQQRKNKMHKKTIQGEVWQMWDIEEQETKSWLMTSYCL
jgi:hypothetical protein